MIFGKDKKLQKTTGQKYFIQRYHSKPLLLNYPNLLFSHGYNEFLLHKRTVTLRLYFLRISIGNFGMDSKIGDKEVRVPQG